MAELLLPSGDTVIFDDTDQPLIREHRWYVHKVPNSTIRYARTERRRGIALMMHRLIANPSDSQLVDHINGNGLDNRRSNLRLCTHSENMRNQRRVAGKVPFKGVWIDRKNLRFRASITVDGVSRKLGSFRTAEDAALAYDDAATKIFGEFACTNKSLGLIQVKASA